MKATSWRAAKDDIWSSERKKNIILLYDSHNELSLQWWMVHVHRTSSDIILIHPISSEFGAVWLTGHSHGELGRFTVHYPVCRGCDQSHQIKWGEVERTMWESCCWCHQSRLDLTCLSVSCLHSFVVYLCVCVCAVSYTHLTLPTIYSV